MSSTHTRRGWHGQDGASASEEKDRRAASRAAARQQEASVGHRKEPWHDSRLVHRVTQQVLLPPPRHPSIHNFIITYEYILSSSCQSIFKIIWQ